MKVSKFSPFDRGDYPESPEWFDAFLKKLNGTLKEYTTVLAGQVSIADNLNAVFVTLPLSDGVSQDFTINGLRGKPLGISLVESETDEQPDLDLFRALDVNQARVQVSWASPPSGTANVTFILWGL